MTSTCSAAGLVHVIVPDRMWRKKRKLPNKWHQSLNPLGKIAPQTEVRSKRRMLWLKGVQIYNNVCE